MTLAELRNTKRLSNQEITATVRSLAPLLADTAPGLRQILDSGTMFRFPLGEGSDSMLVEIALLSLILAGVSTPDPAARKDQLGAINKACGNLGHTYEDVLRTTENEEAIARLLEPRLQRI
jgi:hypothetical protein